MNPLQKAARDNAAPMLAPAPGLPLVKSTANLGRRLEWRRGRSTVDSDMPDELRKEHVRRDTEIFIKWMEKEDGARFRGQVKVDPPVPHLEVKPPNVQVGDRGGTRQVARNLLKDATDTGKEDYIIWCLFDVPEAIQVVPTSLAIDMFGKGRPGLRPLRERDWMKEGSNRWSRRQ